MSSDRMAWASRAARHGAAALVGVAALASPAVAAAQADALSWHAPAQHCPDEATVRAWLVDELSRADGAVAPRVVASASLSAEGWSAVVRRRRGPQIVASEVHAEDCVSLARSVVQEIVFDAAVLPEASSAPPPPPVAFVYATPYARATGDLETPPRIRATPPPRPPTVPRYWIDLGAGAGVALIAGLPALAEAIDTPNGTLCGDRACPASMDAGLAGSTFIRLAMRARVTDHVALGVALRLQLDAAPRYIEAHDATNAVTTSNEFGLVLVNVRAYWSPQGFRARGFSWAVLAGIGGGRMQPPLPVDSGAVLHADAGPFNAHVGALFEYGLFGHLHLAAECALHLMAPDFLVEADATLSAGAHF